jgi:hypothetical protein
MAKTNFNPQTDGFSKSWQFEGVEIDALGSAVAAGVRATALGASTRAHPLGA